MELWNDCRTLELVLANKCCSGSRWLWTRPRHPLKTRPSHVNECYTKVTWTSSNMRKQRRWCILYVVVHYWDYRLRPEKHKWDTGRFLCVVLLDRMIPLALHKTPPISASDYPTMLKFEIQRMTVPIDIRVLGQKTLHCSSVLSVNSCVVSNMPRNDCLHRPETCLIRSVSRLSTLPRTAVLAKQYEQTAEYESGGSLRRFQTNDICAGRMDEHGRPTKVLSLRRSHGRKHHQDGSRWWVLKACNNKSLMLERSTRTPWDCALEIGITWSSSTLIILRRRPIKNIPNSFHFHFWIVIQKVFQLQYNQLSSITVTESNTKIAFSSHHPEPPWCSLLTAIIFTAFWLFPTTTHTSLECHRLLQSPLLDDDLHVTVLYVCSPIITPPAHTLAARNPTCS